MRITNLLIWDSANPLSACQNTEQIIVFWHGYSTRGFAHAVSIPQWVEDHADGLRQRYLAWVYEVGETRIRGERVIDHLALRPGFSVWWMTLLAEKCNFAKSPQIEDAIKLLALTDWLGDRVPDRIVLASAKNALANNIKHWCDANKVDFQYQRGVNEKAPASFLRKMYVRLPHTIRALIWLAHHIKSRWSLCGAGLQDWRNNPGDISFVSYLFNLAPDAAVAGVFESRYWGHLPETLLQDGVKTRWLHLYVKDDVLPTAGQAAAQINRFNQRGAGVQNHVTLDSFLSVAIIGKALADWLYLLRKGMGLRLHKHMPSLGELDLWPLFQQDWENSVIGATALQNALTLNLFEAAFNSAPHQRCGVYLQENMDWEYAALYAWKANRHGEMIGCPHTSVRYWDLRYFYDPRIYRDNQKNAMPQPDQVAVNGLAAREAYREGDYPEKDLVDVEALRFLHLNQTLDKVPRKVTIAPGTNSGDKSRIRLLVLGEYHKTTTDALLKLLHDSADSLPQPMSIIVKPHPACPIDVKKCPELPMTLSTQLIAELSKQSDLALTGSVTTAALDAYCLGLPIISFLDPNILNMSPMRGRTGVTFVETPEELITAIRHNVANTSTESRSEQFFYLDKALPKWKNLLNTTIN